MAKVPCYTTGNKNDNVLRKYDPNKRFTQNVEVNENPYDRYNGKYEKYDGHDEKKRTLFVSATTNPKQKKNQNCLDPERVPH